MSPEEARAAVEEYGSQRKAARALGVGKTTVQRALHGNVRPSVAPPLPEAHIPIGEIRRRLKEDFERRHKRRQAELWLPIRLPESDPCAMVWFGDPHLGDDDCNLPLLEQHINACKQPGVYGACVGDYSNNWVGRLMRKYADQETSRTSERELIKWFAHDCGVDWRLWLFGNHDQWCEGEAILGLIVNHAYYVASWEAKIRLQVGREEWKVHAAHSFPGHSMWNSNHGGLRKARMNSPAELFVEGHTHNYGLQEFEKPGDGRVAKIVQTRGYKWADEYAVVKGYDQVQSGASVCTIFDPGARSACSRVLTFGDVESGTDYLQWMRGKRIVRAKPISKKDKRK